MNQQTTSTRTRQGFNVTVGWIGVVLGLVIAGASIFPGVSRSGALAGVVLAILSYVVMVRPWIGLDTENVVISNVLRETTLPWAGVSHASSRGTLTIHDNDGHRTTVWAIGSQKASASADRGADLDVRPSFRTRIDPGSLAERPKSARALTEAINAETTDNDVDTPSGRVTRWLPVPCALMALALIAVITAIL